MKEFVGEVVSNKSEKTALVRVDWVAVHPVYKKRVRRSQKIKAHDTLGVNIGDRVKIIETRPISKDKHFLIKEVLKK
ncbi:MAG: 30S ribosomal protein S17 [Candidatus Woykebacteria bacterium RIFCSPHIGHO2_12_FULL_43_10]|uniref:Small ribosomal subunit protein uS17 n=2 Tax=Candidatus Woykeibacteriota TaxID=1817899 RepID=A0A1G1WXL9_9BACT|nr:MAG: 30S ribosomal protein S17 [Candidatus Woykebacteria bacterium RIFCSPHIGHO2_01_FULL_43_29]OGY28705.1 MAG: 30S ribosomal protein S17 [Candidatus Woykebacteria bacterium RIFCSPHIGHO2_02_FULL_43_16b]OGY29780.1 MAG: 30S ribosomal protein S17 [Candidatus Woykebacteria bacterium RIFCSPHIGHO2_12_FULL_43_10]OGY32454.1 MAG: 30S ribosomal protein S17 [Candidatus Woykebacteria bacterium RIFCSPLOWO2_01_FULL_43_14]